MIHAPQHRHATAARAGRPALGQRVGLPQSRSEQVRLAIGATLHGNADRELAAGYVVAAKYGIRADHARDYLNAWRNR